MYCMRCGAELPEEAKFCTGCGARVAQGAAAATAQSAAAVAAKPAEADGPAVAVASESLQACAAAPAASGNPFQEAVDSARKRSRRRAPLILVVALALALMSAVAYAAYYVYTEVYLPQQQAQQAADASGGDVGTTEDAGADTAGAEDAGADASDTEAESEPESSDEAVATGNPQNVFQVAELLTMDAAEMSSYFESQGFGLTTLPQGGSDSGFFFHSVVEETDLWQASKGDYAAFSAVDPEGTVFSESELPDYSWNGYEDLPMVAVGSSALCPYAYYARGLLSADDLAAGTSPESVFIANLPISTFDESSVRALSEIAGLGSPSAHFNYAVTSEYAAWASVDIYAGTASSDSGNDLVWYAVYVPAETEEDATSYTYSGLGCATMSAALAVVQDAGLYLDEEWDAASAEDKALMYAQSLAQQVLLPTNGGYRENVLTGNVEQMQVSDGAPTWTAV